jgi:Uma2 family endonuclease
MGEYDTLGVLRNGEIVMTIQMPESPPSPRLTNSLVRITTDQYHKMIEQGILPEDSSTELLDGLIVHKDKSDFGGDPMGHGPAHRLAVRLLTRLAARIDSEFHHLQIQLPVELFPFDEPEPDGAIIMGPDRKFAERLPAPADVAAVFEVAHSSLERDSNEKLTKFAKAGIPQYVLINLRESHVEVYTSADRAGERYQTKCIAGKGDRLALNLGNGESLEVQAAELLP